MPSCSAGSERVLIVLVAVLLRSRSVSGLKDIILQPDTSSLLLAVPDISGTQLFNPSVLVAGDQVLCAFRGTNVTKRGNIEWWSNRAFICQSYRRDFKTAVCSVFEPFGSRRTACAWTDGTEGTDTEGIEDVKLFNWPGKGECRACCWHIKPSRCGAASARGNHSRKAKALRRFMGQQSRHSWISGWPPTCMTSPCMWFC